MASFSQDGRILKSFPIQGLDGLHAFVELAVAFPSQDCFAQSVYSGSWGVEFNVLDFRSLPITEGCPEPPAFEAGLPFFAQVFGQVFRPFL